MRHFLLLSTLAILCLDPASVRADNKATPDFNETVWKIRVAAYGIISTQQSLVDLMQWCAEGKDNLPCDTIDKVGLSTENDVKEYRMNVAKLLKALETEPKTKGNLEHIRILTAQLEQLNALPTPYSEMLADAMIKGK